jgi:hypothetical protein
MNDESRKSVLRDVLAHAGMLEADIDRMLPLHKDNPEEIKEWMLLKVAMISVKLKVNIDMAEEEDKESSGK